MARVIKEEEYTTRRNEILDAAQRLVYTKGYEQMTIQDILETLNISKGAFYHYFSSKQDLLEAMIDRIQVEAVALLSPIVDDPNKNALQKLGTYFDTAGKWKMQRKAYMAQLLGIWYADDNALVRQKVLSATAKWIGPLLAKIVRQGIEEGILNTPFPDQIGEITIALFANMGETFAKAILQHSVDIKQVDQMVEGYTDAIERVLGAPPGSLVLIDHDSLVEWLS